MRFVRSPFFFLIVCVLSAQGQSGGDTLPEVTVGIYLDAQRPLLRLPASVTLIDSSAMSMQHGQSLVPVLNTAPGVRMEERSPGSYRLSIRGSLIRSPFGVRNVKTYIDGFPLTNGGGETYLNVIDLHAIRSLEISKGPDGSLFGANSGGVLQLNTRDKNDTSKYLRLNLGAGSFGMLQESVQLRVKAGRSLFGFDQGYTIADGYRDHSSLNRKYYQITNKLNYSSGGGLKALFFYADHAYQTPGGLTFGQMITDPRQARPATPFTRGAEEQNSSVWNRTFFGGVTNEVRFKNGVKHVLSIFGSQTRFENPFITNYEFRNESNIGARTWFVIEAEEVDWTSTINFGGEYQEMTSTIDNFTNEFGQPGALTESNLAGARTGFIFVRLNWNYRNRFQAEASVSDNFNVSQIQKTQPIAVESTPFRFRQQLMPRFAASYLAGGLLSIRAIISRGYSPPTLQEIKPSNQATAINLQPEHGWNYEGGIRLQTKNNRFWWDLSAFYFLLEDAIVRNVDPRGNEYFENTGGTDQKGIETVFRLEMIKPKSSGFLRQLSLTSSGTASYFIFTKGSIAGKQVTGVPQYVVVSSISSKFGGGFYLFLQHNHTGSLPLDDLNSTWSGDYDLFMGKIGWMRKFKHLGVDLNAGIDNMSDSLYSLGHDLNAVGMRYYNPAPTRNYFIRVGFTY